MMKLSEAIRVGAALRPKINGNMFGVLDEDGYAVSLVDARYQGAITFPGEESIFFSGPDRDKVRSCALGAAYEGVFGEIPIWDDFERLQVAYPELKSCIRAPDDAMQYIDHIDKDELGKTTYVIVREVITTLNDHCDWSREQIAAYLEEGGL